MARAQPVTLGESLDALATTLGHDACLESRVTGDREYRDRNGLDLDDMFERYWDARYRAVFLSAVLAVGAPVRPASVEVLLERAFGRYASAARDVERAAIYEAGISKKARHQLAQRMRLLRFFDGRQQRKITVLSVEQAQQQLASEAAHLATSPGDEPRDALIEEAICEEPYDPIRYGVYSDWLQEQGHPRGELIALQLATERDSTVRPKANAFFERHIDTFLGGLAKHLRDHDPRRRPEAFVWRFGFVHAARIVGVPRGVDPMKMLRDVLEHPSGRFLAELSVRDTRPARNLQPMIDLLVARFPAALRKLQLGGRDSVYSRAHDKGDLGRAWAAFQPLRELVLDGAFQLGELDLPRVTRLELRPASFDDDVRQALSHARWPALEALLLGFDVRQTVNRELGGWLERLDLPKLVELQVDSSSAADELAAAIARAPGRTRLRRLAFRRCHLTVEGVRALVAGGLELDQIDIRECYVNIEGLRLLRRIAKQIEHQPQWGS